MELTKKSRRLADLGRREEALAAGEQAVAIRRQLAKDHPDTYLPQLAATLNNQSLRLADLGRREEALAAGEQAVAIRRQLAKDHPDTYLPHLAASLDNLAATLWSLGRDAEASAIREEADAVAWEQDPRRRLRLGEEQTGRRAAHWPLQIFRRKPASGLP
jgi:tetratricopeptide (TPR) repeat protein